MLLEKTLNDIGPLDREAMKAARRRVDSLIKPPGSLGKLEELAVRLAGIQGREQPDCSSKSVILMAGDHGVVAEGVSAAPQEITYQMLSAFTGGVAGISVMSRLAGARLVVVDVGVARQVDIPGVLNYKVRKGTGNIAAGPAMSREEAVQALEAGIKVAVDEINMGAQLLAVGDMGIGNTTPSSAILAVLGGIPASQATGRGTMVNDQTLNKKVWAVEQAINTNRPDPADGIDVVAKVGGLEIAGLAGVMLGAASMRTPVLIDGFITTAAAMVACAIKKEAGDYLIASHLSGEQGHGLMLKYLNLRPMIDLEMRLGEGTGAVLAMVIVEAACRILGEMASFRQAAVSELDAEKVL